MTVDAGTGRPRWCARALCTSRGVIGLSASRRIARISDHAGRPTLCVRVGALGGSLLADVRWAAVPRHARAPAGFESVPARSTISSGRRSSGAAAVCVCTATRRSATVRWSRHTAPVAAPASVDSAPSPEGRAHPRLWRRAALLGVVVFVAFVVEGYLSAASGRRYGWWLRARSSRWSPHGRSAPRPEHPGGSGVGRGRGVARAARAGAG